MRITAERPSPRMRVPRLLANGESRKVRRRFRRARARPDEVAHANDCPGGPIAPHVRERVEPGLRLGELPIPRSDEQDRERHHRVGKRPERHHRGDAAMERDDAKDGGPARPLLRDRRENEDRQRALDDERASGQDGAQPWRLVHADDVRPERGDAILPEHPVNGRSVVPGRAHLVQTVEEVDDGEIDGNRDIRESRHPARVRNAISPQHRVDREARAERHERRPDRHHVGDDDAAVLQDEVPVVERQQTHHNAKLRELGAVADHVREVHDRDERESDLHFRGRGERKEPRPDARPHGREEGVVVRENAVVRVEGDRVGPLGAIVQIREQVNAEDYAKEPERTRVDGRIAVHEKGKSLLQRTLHGRESQSRSCRDQPAPGKRCEKRSFLSAAPSPRARPREGGIQ